MATLYYRVTPINELGEGDPVTGSYDPEAPTAGSVTEGGGDTLTFGLIADGQLLRRSGAAIVGADAADLTSDPLLAWLGL